MPENVNRERELAARIVDKYARRILGKAIEKGYTVYPFSSFVEGVVVDDQTIRYAVSIEGREGEEKYAIDILEDRTGDETEAEHMEDAKNLSFDGRLFARYVKPVLAHLDGTVKGLPVFEMASGSFNEENLEGVMENAATLDTCFVLKVSGSKGDAPVIGQVPTMPTINRNNYEKAVRLYIKNGIENMTTPEIEHFRYLATMLPFVKETRLIGELSGAFNDLREKTLGDGCQVIEAAYIDSKGFKNLETLLETRFGEFSRLTKEQQEMFLKNARVLLESMDDENVDGSDMVKIYPKGRDKSRKSERDYIDLQILDIRTKKKTSLEPIAGLLRNILWSFGKVYNEVHSVHFLLEVSFPHSKQSPEGDAPFAGFIAPSGASARFHLADVLQSATGYALFTAAADIVSGRVDKKFAVAGARERHSLVRSSFVDVCAKALHAIIERIASGPNESLVNIMRGGEKPAKKKAIDVQLWRKKIVDTIVASCNTLNAVVVNETRAGNYVEGDIGYSVPLAIDNAEWGKIRIQIRTLTVHGGYMRAFLAGPVELVEDPVSGSDSRTYPLGSLGGGSFNQTKTELAALLSDIVEKNPESKTARYFREKPDLLCRAIKEGYKKCTEDFQAAVRQKTLAEKEEYYRIFQKEFPEDLMEGYCRLSGL